MKRALLAFPQWFSRYHPTHFQSNFHLWHFSSVEAVDIVIEKLSRTKVSVKMKMDERQKGKGRKAEGSRKK